MKEYFSGEDAIKNLTLLESYFDCWLKIKKDELPFTEFFESLMGHTHQTGKITVEKGMRLMSLMIVLGTTEN